MKRRTRIAWLVFIAGSLAVAAALVWVSAVVLRLERAETAARDEAAHQERIRLALWRMDSWLAPRLARESARPYFEYLPYIPQDRAYTRLLNRIEIGEVLTPSPLLTAADEYFPLHFQLGRGDISSPQVPIGNQRDLAEAGGLPGAEIDRQAQKLQELGDLLAVEQLQPLVSGAEERMAVMSCQTLPAASAADQASGTSAQVLQQQEFSRTEARKRAENWSIAQQAQILNPPTDPATVVDADRAVTPLEGRSLAGETTIEVGPLVPLWLGGDGAQLVFIRRVVAGVEDLFQGVLADWPRLQAVLLDQVRDLFPDAVLARSSAGPVPDESSGRMLATIPAILLVENRTPRPAAWLTPARLTLVLVWLAAAASCAAVGTTLRKSLQYGDRRSRFASAVTHELRTPLTTFRLYSEMLADGMVTDPARKREYLETLKGESTRLSNLVENVLAYARLEDGRAASRPRVVSLKGLLESVVPPLRRRASDAAMTLSVVCSGREDMTMETDPEAVGQILFNLVDNACKYANGASRRLIELRATMVNGTLEMSVVDFGPGVSPSQRHRIFEPFERGGKTGPDVAAAPGVGLGLALARQLARDLGGSLTCEPGPGRIGGERPVGACFSLRLPCRR